MKKSTKYVGLLLLSASIFLTGCQKDTILLDDPTYEFDIEDSTIASFSPDLLEQLAYSEVYNQTTGYVNTETNEEEKRETNYYFFFAPEEATTDTIEALKLSIEEAMVTVLEKGEAQHTVAYLLESEKVYHTMQYYLEESMEFPLDDYLLGFWMSIDEALSAEYHYKDFELTKKAEKPTVEHEIDTEYIDPQGSGTLSFSVETPMLVSEAHSFLSYYATYAKKELDVNSVFLQIKNGNQIFTYDETKPSQLKHLTNIPFTREAKKEELK